MSKQQGHQTCPLLGCVADDMTGATDLANNLVGAGMSVIQFFAIPTVEEMSRSPADAIVVALKTRSIEPADAASQSVEAVKVLQQAGCQRFIFKYCSTFDSTDHGNIGPVAEAIMNFLGEPQTIYCPAFPRAGRTVYQGHLFVGHALLNESGMQNHPINPMNDANLVRVLTRQTTRPVGLVDHARLGSAETISNALAVLQESGIAHVITDTCDEVDLKTIAESASKLRLITGGSGIASYLPEFYRQQEMLQPFVHQPTLPTAVGRSLILSGSCSTATNRQVAVAARMYDVWPVDVARVVEDFDREQSSVANWIRNSDPARPLMVYSTANAQSVRETQQELGSCKAADTVERFFGSIARQAVQQFDVRRLIVAGGETSGAVVQAIDVDAIRIGPEICTGVPWTETIGDPSIALALKSGNFGDDEFFIRALEMLE